MKIQTALFAALLSAGFVSAHAESVRPIDADKITARQSVNYACQGGKRLTVRYGFNAAGIPVSATAKVGKHTQTMRYNLDRSDDVDTIFTNKNGFRMNMENMERSNVRRAAIATITNPKNEIVYKSCIPRR